MKSKLFVGIIFLNLCSFFVIQADSAFEQASLDAGKARVFEVMYKGYGGIAQGMRYVSCAETQNIGLDLNLPELSQRFDCKTLMGQAFIAFMLSKPMSSQDTNGIIQQRQTLIQMLVENPELQEKIEDLLAQAVEHEAVVMQCMKNRFVMDPHGDPIKFILQCMKSNVPLQVYEQACNIDTIVSGPDRFMYKFKNVSTAWNDLSVAQKAFLAGLTWTEFSHYVEANRTFGWEFYETTRVAWFVLLSGYGMYNHYIEAFEIRRSLHSLYQLISIAEQIEALCLRYKINHQFKISSISSRKGRDLIDNLHASRYQDKDSYFFLTPAVHTFLMEVYERDMHLAPVYTSIAEMDAYLAIARKMKQLEHTDHQFCFTQFLDDVKPSIQAKGFWNLLISKGSIVINDLFEDRNIILTGSNEGGKTTTIRAILQNIVLSQTFGVAAALDFKMTMFDVIHSYLHVSDDILHGRSRYAVELKQAQDILHRIENLQSHEKFFFTLDELFTGTNGQDGAVVAYNFIQNVANQSKIQFIYATHFDILKTIGSENPCCANYKIEAPYRDAQGNFIRDQYGQLIYPYKLSPGANDVNVALERAKDAGIFATN